MDDFGTGYSSLAYLTQLPLDQLKIDQSFVRNIGTKSTDAMIIQTIIGMANNLGIEVIAEGVETDAQRDFLSGGRMPVLSRLSVRQACASEGIYRLAGIVRSAGSLWVQRLWLISMRLTNRA